MLQNLAIKIATNPVVLETLEVLVVGAVISGASAFMDSYIDRTARKRAERIIKTMNKGR